MLTLDLNFAHLRKDHAFRAVATTRAQRGSRRIPPRRRSELEKARGARP